MRKEEAMGRKTSEKTERLESLQGIFRDIDPGERVLVDQLIREVAFLEERMEELREQPFIVHHPTRPGVMKSTPAAKQYKECSQSYMNAVRILLNTLRKTQTDAADELLKRLEEFA